MNKAYKDKYKPGTLVQLDISLLGNEREHKQRYLAGGSIGMILGETSTEIKKRDHHGYSGDLIDVLFEGRIVVFDVDSLDTNTTKI